MNVLASIVISGLVWLVMKWRARRKQSPDA
jgi:hypothetical protein